MKLISIVKTYRYKTAKSMETHQKEMKGKGFRIWCSAVLPDRSCSCDYVKEFVNG